MKAGQSDGGVGYYSSTEVIAEVLSKIMAISQQCYSSFTAVNGHGRIRSYLGIKFQVNNLTTLYAKASNVAFNIIEASKYKTVHEKVLFTT